ncbi:unnamed protein product [Cylicocyclus nassatus]|uniref:PAN-3 domain-containing protein n=1 Tax=Cylicocyclus nassatus TaxID=53992 RepID=A0AA36M737_CYLNA|nr:unnamed protein product [Cylicocyclus nassatus]
MLSITPIFIVMLTAKMTSNSGVFYFNPEAPRGEPIFQYYAENKAQCLRACYEESDCAVVEHDETDDNYCRLYKEGNGSVEAYVLSREATDSSCMTETTTTDVRFQKIPRRENVKKGKCTSTQNVTVIMPYKREGRYRFFVPESSRIPYDWDRMNFKLTFSSKPEPTCTSVPVFHRADYRRLYFGEVYNVTGYYFHNAYAFADPCTPAGECLGKVEIQEYVDENGDFFYDKAGEENKKNKRNSGLRQTFFIVEKRPW